MIACATETPDEIVDEVYGDLSGPLQAQALDPQRPVATRRSWTVVPSVRVYFWNDFRSGPFCAVGGGNHKVFAAATITAKASVALDVPAALSSRMTREVRFSRVTSVDDCVDTGIPMTLSSLQSGIGTLIFVRFKDTLCVTGQGCQNHETNFDSIDSSGKVTNVEDRALTSDALQRQHFRWTLGWGDVVADLPAYTNTNAPLERATPLIRCDTVRYFQPTRRGCVFRDILGKMGFDQSTIPNVTANIADAWARGKPNILRRRVNERLKRRNRAIACAPLRRTTTPPPGKNSCDEYPMAVTWQGGRGAITAWVPGVENSRQGGAMSRAFREDRILDGERFQVFLYSSAL